MAHSSIPVESVKNGGPPRRPLLVFDGDCSFCKAWVEYWKQRTGPKVDCISYQELGGTFEISREEFASAVKLITPDGEVRSGAHAVFKLLDLVPAHRWLLWLYLQFPIFASLAEFGYQFVARHRSLGYKVTHSLWGIPIEPQTFRAGSWIFLRALGLVYAIAFASFGTQAAGLIGSRGISPISQLLPPVHSYYGAAAYWNLPTLLWFNASDAAIKVLWITGLCLSLLMALGIQWRLVRIALFVLYLSLTSAGQQFMGYQWDALLLEAGFLAIFLGLSPIIIWLYRWLLFKLMFLSGAVKLASGDPSWRHFTALPVHYQTQPLPTPLAWYVYQWPTWFQHISLVVVFFVELLAPFFIFSPPRARAFAAKAIIAFQVLILLTGNFAFFNILTIALCIFLLNDNWMERTLPEKIRAKLARQPVKPATHFARVLCRPVATVVLFVGVFQVIAVFGLRWTPSEIVTAAIAPMEIANSYGLFAVMTTTRPEIIIEGSNDGSTWLPYEFKYKPGELWRRPPWIAPFQPRLDWQMWFAALGDYQTDPWIIRLVSRLLEGSPDVLALFQENPFPLAPPHYVRAMLYEYRFTTPAQKEATGNWWTRELKGAYIPAVGLRDIQ
jgi:predicted DCC family thiol-disulfide oxidoreductase YuxK